ncbi:uncharacterized protein [Dermacentor albipictus]|uniref:uncharacterized protein isoform X2 n=1 Tax=Dermacentor albipictus TaxID=60249 RepID=UPI0038FBF757
MKKAANFRHVFAVSFQTTGGSNKYAARRVRANDRTLSGTMQPTEASRTTTSIASVPRTRAERTRPAPQPTRVATTRAVANRAVAPLESRIRGARLCRPRLNMGWPDAQVIGSVVSPHTEWLHTTDAPAGHSRNTVQCSSLRFMPGHQTRTLTVRVLSSRGIPHFATCKHEQALA